MVYVNLFTSFTRDHHTPDLVFSSDPNIISDLCVQDTFSTSDHSMAVYNLIVRPHDCSSSVKSVIYDYNHADYDGICNFLLNDPFLTNPCFNDGETADQTWENFFTPIHKAIELYVPTKIVCPPVRVSRRSKYRPRHICHALNKKCHLWRLHRKNKTLISKSQYEKQSAYVKKLIFDYQKQTESQL